MLWPIAPFYALAPAAGSCAGPAWFWLGGEPGWWVAGLEAWEGYLQSGKQRTIVRQAKDSQASKGPLSGKPRTDRQAMVDKF